MQQQQQSSSPPPPDAAAASKKRRVTIPVSETAAAVGPVTDVTVFLLCVPGAESMLDIARYTDGGNNGPLCLTPQQREAYGAQSFGTVRDGRWSVGGGGGGGAIPPLWQELVRGCTHRRPNPVAYLTEFPLVYEEEVRECLRRVKEEDKESQNHHHYLEVLVNHLRTAWRRALVGRVLAVDDPDVRLYGAELRERFGDYPLLPSSPQHQRFHTPSELLFIVRHSERIMRTMAEMERGCDVFSGFPRQTNGARWLRFGPAPESIRAECVAYVDAVVRDVRALLRAVRDADFGVVRLIRILERIADDRGRLSMMVTTTAPKKGDGGPATKTLALAYHVSLRWQLMRELYDELKRRCSLRGMGPPSAITVVQEYHVWERGFVRWWEYAGGDGRQIPMRRHSPSYYYADPMLTLHALGTDGSRESLGGLGGGRGPADAVRFKTSFENVGWCARMSNRKRLGVVAAGGDDHIT